MKSVTKMGVVALENASNILCRPMPVVGNYQFISLFTIPLSSDTDSGFNLYPP